MAGSDLEEDVIDMDNDEEVQDDESAESEEQVEDIGVTIVSHKKP